MSIENVCWIVLAIIAISFIFISIKWVKPHVNVAFFALIEVWWGLLAMFCIFFVVKSYVL